MLVNSRRSNMARHVILSLATITVFAMSLAQSGAEKTSAPAGAAPTAADTWRSFSGSWYATGTRQTVPT